MGGRSLSLFPMTPDMTAFSVRVVQAPTGPVITPHGDIDMATTDELERARRQRSECR